MLQGREESVAQRQMVKEAFVHFLNKDSNQTAEFLAKYLDHCLKKSSGQTNLGDDFTEKIIDDTIAIFRFVDSKDTFE